MHHIKSDQFVENARAVFEEVKADDRIRKVIFTRDNTTDFSINDAINTRIAKLKTFKGLWLMLRCKVLFVTHSVAMDYSFRWSEGFSVLKLDLRRRHIINLWHGIPLKKLYALWNPQVKERLDRIKYRQVERRHYEGLIASSQIDSYAMATMFHPIKYDHIWLTGLPRNDFLLRSFEKLPLYLQKQIVVVRQIKNDKRLVTYAPTYRQTAAVTGSAYYQFSGQEINKLKKLLKKHNAVFGFRMHYFRNASNLFNMEKYIDNESIFDLGHQAVSEIAPIIRESDMIITDYSSVYIEALYKNKPVLSFAYDIEHYKANQDGLLYDMKIAFPGPVVSDFEELLIKMDEELSGPSLTQTERYQLAQKLFYEFKDDQNSKRVVQRINNLHRARADKTIYEVSNDVSS